MFSDGIFYIIISSNNSSISSIERIEMRSSTAELVAPKPLAKSSAH